MQGRARIRQGVCLAVLTAGFLFCAAPVWAEDSPTTLDAAVRHNLQRLGLKANSGASDLLSIETADTVRFAPQLQSGFHHAEGNPVPVENTIGLDATTMTLELSQPIYRSGQSRAQAQLSESRERVAEADNRLKKQSATLLIIKTYLDAQREHAQVDLMRQLSYAPQELKRKEDNLTFLRQELQDMGGLRSEAPLAAISGPAKLPRSLQAALSIAEDKHPAMIKAHYECAAAEASSRWVNWQQEPDIDLRGALDRTVDSFSDSLTQDSGTIGLRATIPFSGDSAAKSRQGLAREDAESTRLNIDSTRLRIRQDVIAAWDAVTKAKSELAFQQHKSRLALAGAEGRLPKESRLSGRTDSATFSSLARHAQVAAVAAETDIIKAEYALLAATGQLLDSLDSLPAAVPDLKLETAENMERFPSLGTLNASTDVAEQTLLTP